VPNWRREWMYGITMSMLACIRLYNTNTLTHRHKHTGTDTQCTKDTKHMIRK
jgi:hypothetical protein